MSWVLLANDDGVDSPALLPFAAALEHRLGLPVAVCVPDGDRSWTGKAVTRHGGVRLREVRRGGRRVATTTGTPADAVQLGLYAAFATEFGGAPPTVVVSGINIGLNTGSAFLASSGTVWSAAEASLAGIPAVAVSTGSTSDHVAWRAAATGPDAAADWRRVADVAATVVRRVGDTPLHAVADLVSVNLPWTADAATPVRVTSLARAGYGPLFAPTDDDGAFAFVDRLALHRGDDADDADVDAVADGVVSVTPVVLPRSAPVDAALRAAVES